MFTSNFIKNNLSQVMQFGSRWVLNIILAFCLTKEQFANFSFAYSISNILMGIVPFGAAVFLLNSDSIRIKKTLEKSLSLLFILQLVVIILYLFLSIFFSDTDGWSYIFGGVILGFIFSFNLIFYSYYKSLNKFNVEFYSCLLILALTIPFLLYVYNYKHLSIEFIFLYLILINLFCSIFLYKISKIQFKEVFLNFKNFPRIFKERKYFGGQEILNTIINQFSLIILFYMLVKEEYAIFRTFLIIISPFMLFTTATGQVVLLYFKKIANNLVQLKRKIIFVQIYTFALGLLSFTSICFLASYIFSFFNIGENYYYAFYIMISTIILRLCLSNNEMFLVVVGQQKNRFLIMLFSAVLSLIIIILLTPTLGMLSAVLANLIANLILILCSTYFVFKYLRTAS